MNAERMERIIGEMTNEETIEMAKACLEELSDEDQVQLIREICLEDQDFTDELVASIEELTSQ